MTQHSHAGQIDHDLDDPDDLDPILPLGYPMEDLCRTDLKPGNQHVQKS